MLKPAFAKRYFIVNRADIAYLRFITESYDGLATLSTVEGKRGLVSLSFPSCFASDVDRLVQALRCEITMTETTPTGGTTEVDDQFLDKQESELNA